jgi:hypothetical protein
MLRRNTTVRKCPMFSLIALYFAYRRNALVAPIVPVTADLPKQAVAATAANQQDVWPMRLAA